MQDIFIICTCSCTNNAHAAQYLINNNVQCIYVSLKTARAKFSNFENIDLLIDLISFTGYTNIYRSRY